MILRTCQAGHHPAISAVRRVHPFTRTCKTSTPVALASGIAQQALSAVEAHPTVERPDRQLARLSGSGDACLLVSVLFNGPWRARPPLGVLLRPTESATRPFTLCHLSGLSAVSPAGCCGYGRRWGGASLAAASPRPHCPGRRSRSAPAARTAPTRREDVPT